MHLFHHQDNHAMILRNFLPKKLHAEFRPTFQATLFPIILCSIKFPVISSLVWVGIQIGSFLSPTQSDIPCYRRPTKSLTDQKVIKLPRKTALWQRPAAMKNRDDGGRGGSWKSSLWRGDEKVLYGTSFLPQTYQRRCPPETVIDEFYVQCYLHKPP